MSKYSDKIRARKEQHAAELAADSAALSAQEPIENNLPFKEFSDSMKAEYPDREIYFEQVPKKGYEEHMKKLRGVFLKYRDLIHSSEAGDQMLVAVIGPDPKAHSDHSKYYRLADIFKIRKDLEEKLSKQDRFRS